MSEQVSKQKTDSSGRLAVVGDRELVIGYRLIGIDDTFIVSNEDDASKKIQELYSSGEFGLIIASNSMRAKLSSKFVRILLFCLSYIRGLSICEKASDG